MARLIGVKVAKAELNNSAVNNEYITTPLHSVNKSNQYCINLVQLVQHIN
jgi:hypothetical protein